MESEDEPVIRQAISLYQMKNPEIYVEYEVGLEGNAATREDVIKNLNTRMMAGEGPDVLILDNMPMILILKRHSYGYRSASERSA